MSFLSDLFDFGTAAFSAFSGGGGTSSLLGTVINAGTTIAGGVIQANANTRAARTIADANIAASEAEQALIREGNVNAQAEFDRLKNESAGSTAYLQSVVGQDPTRLTPQQAERLIEIQRQASSSPGFRSSGRTRKALSDASTLTFTNEAIQQNRNRSDTAARYLSERGVGAGTRSALASIGEGTALAGTVPNSGETIAGAGVANAGITADTMGSLASFINNDEKDRSRLPKYADYEEVEA